MSKILIIEDEVAIADLEKDYLELSGFDVEVANDGLIGYQKAMEEDYNLVIMDLKSAASFVKRRIHQSSWYLRRKMILIRSGVWVWELMII